MKGKEVYEQRTNFQLYLPQSKAYIMKYCEKCGHENADHAAFCSSCGHAFATVKTASFTEEVHNSPPKPANHLVWAILTTILCCMPAGIVSIVYSTKVDSHYNAGEFEAAERASKNASTWAVVSGVSGFIFGVIYLVIILASGSF